MTRWQRIRRLLWLARLDVRKFDVWSSPIVRRKRFLETYGIRTILDVGANRGQFAEELRWISYDGWIFSFEPLRDEYQILSRKALRDRRWTTFPYALGDRDERRLINVAGNLMSSSLLEMLPRHLAAAPEAAYRGTEEVEVRTLDSVWEGIGIESGGVLMKLDVQGFERRVLDGAARSIRHIDALQLELSLVPVYRDAPAYSELIAFVELLGFHPVAVEPSFIDGRSGEVLQVDVTFRRT